MEKNCLEFCELNYGKKNCLELCELNYGKKNCLEIWVGIDKKRKFGTQKRMVIALRMRKRLSLCTPPPQKTPAFLKFQTQNKLP